MKKNFFIIIFVFFALVPNKTLAYSSDPEQFITEIVNEAKKILVNTNSKEFKEEKLSQIALKAADGSLFKCLKSRVPTSYN